MFKVSRGACSFNGADLAWNWIVINKQLLFGFIKFANAVAIPFVCQIIQVQTLLTDIVNYLGSKIVFEFFDCEWKLKFLTERVFFIPINNNSVPGNNGVVATKVPDLLSKHIQAILWHGRYNSAEFFIDCKFVLFSFTYYYSSSSS